MRITNHFQANCLFHSFPKVSSFSFENSKNRSVSINIPIDKFFNQEHNLVDGDISTSPLLASDSNSVGHFSPTSDSGGWPADTPDSVIHQSVVSKSLQTPVEVAKLKVLRPQESDYQDKVEVVNEEVSSSVVSE